MNTNPVWSTNGIIAGATALIALAVAFGLPITADQKLAILGAVGIAAPLLAAALTNSKVTPLASPKDEDGLPLIRSDGALPRAQARGMGK